MKHWQWQNSEIPNIENHDSIVKKLWNLGFVSTIKIEIYWIDKKCTSPEF